MCTLDHWENEIIPPAMPSSLFDLNKARIKQATPRSISAAEAAAGRIFPSPGSRRGKNYT